jgi:TonB family protein
MGSSIAIAAASAAFIVQSATPSSPAPLKPAGPWNVEYAERMCILSREFGEGESKMLLVFRPAMFNDQLRVLVVKLASTGTRDSGTARLSMDEGVPIEGRFVEGFNKVEGIRAIAIDVKESSLEPLKSAKQLRIQAGKLEAAIAPTAVAAAMKALETCQKDLLVSWGMDAKVVESIATFPTLRGGLVSLFTTNDYPWSSIRDKEQGTSGVRFWVSKEGKIRDCQVVEPSGSMTLDKQTCEIISRRGRFQPARTSSGEPVESIGFQRVRWELP